MKEYSRNSSTYQVNLSVAHTEGIDSFSNAIVGANSSQISILIPASTVDALLTLVKNAYYVSENSTSVNYNISLQLTNAGGIDLTNIFLNDSDLGINTSVNLNRTQPYFNSSLVSITKTATAQTRTFLLANATVSGISYYSNQLSILIPPLDSNSSLVLSREFSIYLLNSTTVGYNATLTLTNSGGRNITSTMLYDYNSTSSPYTIGTMVPGQTVMQSYLLYFARTSSTQSVSFASANANGTDGISGSIVQANSSAATIVIPSSISQASFVLDKIVSFYNITNESIFYNVSLRLTNRGGSDAINVSLNDSDSSSSPYSLGTLTAGSTNTTSYLINYTRNSTTYTVNLAQSRASGNDSTTLGLINASSSTISLTVPASTPDALLTLVKNAQYTSENSTAVNYTLSLEIVNSGGVDLTGISVIDSDLDLTTTISLNRTQSWNYNGTVLVAKAASNTEEDFVAATATVGGTVYESNEISVQIPGYGGPADAVVYTPAGVNASESFNSIIQVLNMNPDAGQDFIIDYWITDNNYLNNYSAGQRTVYVPALGQTNSSLTLTAPSNNGTYRLHALVSWVGGTATAYNSFIVLGNGSTNSDNSTSGSSSGGSNGGGSSTITGEVIERQAQLLDVLVSILDDSRRVTRKDNVRAQITYFNFGSDAVEDGLVQYCILTENRTVVKCRQETLAIYTQIQVVREFLVSEDMQDGRYYLRATVSYYNATAFSEASFIVISPEPVDTPDSGSSNAKDALAYLGKALADKLSSIAKEVTQNKRGLMALAIISLFVVAALVSRHFKHSKATHPLTLRQVIGKTVYSASGNKIGIVKEAYLEGTKTKLYGWVIRLNRKHSKGLSKKQILVRPGNVVAINTIMIVEDNVAEHIEKFKLDSKNGA